MRGAPARMPWVWPMKCVMVKIMTATARRTKATCAQRARTAWTDNVEQYVQPIASVEHAVTMDVVANAVSVNAVKRAMKMANVRSIAPPIAMIESAVMMDVVANAVSADAVKIVITVSANVSPIVLVDSAETTDVGLNAEYA